MRKLNSTFKTAFLSEAGAALVNNDYFAFVELDEYACYVVADSITDRETSESAKTAVESVLLHFQENPSLRKSAVRSYLKAANQDLLRGSGKETLKASVTVLVTNYETMRYAYAGNARFRLYREGLLKARSLDMSLSQDLVAADEIAPNALDRHAERHNLYTYLGQAKDFQPYVSDKLKLADGDIAVLYTRGVWENLDDADLDDIFSEAGDDPQETLDIAEDMLLSKQPPDLDDYTIAAIFVDKVFADPNRKRKIRQRIKIALIVLVVLLIVGIIAWILYSRHQDKVDEMNLRTENAVAAMQDDNYIRALDETKKALAKAEELKDKEKQDQLSRYLRLVEAVNAADDAYQAKQYGDAYETYQTAKERSRHADNFGGKYVRRRIDQCEERLLAADMIAMGDKLLEAQELEQAEQRYLGARDIAVKLHDPDGKQQAAAALDKLSAYRKQQKDEQEKKAKEKLAADLTDLIAMGDALQKSGDLDAAELKYLEARELAARNYDADGKKETLAALDKLHEAKGKRAEELQKEAAKHAEEYAAAAELAAKGDAAFSASDFSSASLYYNTALEKYAALSDTAQIAILTGKLQNVAVKRQAADAKIAEADALAAQAKELYAQKEYASAKRLYQKAQQAYSNLGNQDRVDEIKAILDQIDIDAAIMELMPQ